MPKPRSDTDKESLPQADPALSEMFRAHQRLLWGLSYRMTGSAEDADDVVQETFARAILRPPRDRERPWRPWLVRVAMNLSRDTLRRRRRHTYEGPWLPSPVRPAAYELPPSESVPTGARYEVLESVSFAFLLTLERLTPQQRAVLVLRDVFEYTVNETAQTLEITAANVKTTLHRARRRMQSYDAARDARKVGYSERVGQALRAFMRSLAQNDVSALLEILSDDATAISDGGGEFHAARKPVVGAARVAHLYGKLARTRGTPKRLDVCILNGLPAIVGEVVARPGEAPRFVLRVEVDAQGRVTEVHSILATHKLSGVFPL